MFHSLRNDKKMLNFLSSFRPKSAPVSKPHITLHFTFLFLSRVFALQSSFIQQSIGSRRKFTTQNSHCNDELFLLVISWVKCWIAFQADYSRRQRNVYEKWSKVSWKFRATVDSIVRQVGWVLVWIFWLSKACKSYQSFLLPNSHNRCID